MGRVRMWCLRGAVWAPTGYHARPIRDLPVAGGEVYRLVDAVGVIFKSKGLCCWQFKGQVIHRGIEGPEEIEAIQHC